MQLRLLTWASFLQIVLGTKHSPRVFTFAFVVNDVNLSSISCKRLNIRYVHRGSCWCSQRNHIAFISSGSAFIKWVLLMKAVWLAFFGCAMNTNSYPNSNQYAFFFVVARCDFSLLRAGTVFQCVRHFLVYNTVWQMHCMIRREHNSL